MSKKKLKTWACILAGAFGATILAMALYLTRPTEPMQVDVAVNVETHVQVGLEEQGGTSSNIDEIRAVRRDNQRGDVPDATRDFWITVVLGFAGGGLFVLLVYILKRIYDE